MGGKKTLQNCDEIHKAAEHWLQKITLRTAQGPGELMISERGNDSHG